MTDLLRKRIHRVIQEILCPDSLLRSTRVQAAVISGAMLNAVAVIVLGVVMGAGLGTGASDGQTPSAAFFVAGGVTLACILVMIVLALPRPGYLWGEVLKPWVFVVALTWLIPAWNLILIAMTGGLPRSTFVPLYLASASVVVTFGDKVPRKIVFTTLAAVGPTLLYACGISTDLAGIAEEWMTRVRAWTIVGAIIIAGLIGVVAAAFRKDTDKRTQRRGS